MATRAWCTHRYLHSLNISTTTFAGTTMRGKIISWLTAADRLVVLEKGKVVEQGLHAELVDKPDGAYAKLHRTQVEMSSLVAIR